MKVIKHYPYRTGFVRGLIVSRDAMKSLEETIYKEIGISSFGNHVCFSVVDEHDKPFAVMFSDFTCTIGKTVEDRKW